MKRKIFIGILIIGSLLMCGCGKKDEQDVLKDLTKKIEETKGYHLTGDLEIVNNEDTYTYDVEASYSKEENFKVSLKNKTNNHEQIILRNSEGIFVLTPSLNKSFKFQSEWPYNNSQSYLLQPILKDIENDKEHTYKETKSGYLFTTTVNYSSNPELVKQEITFDKKLNIQKVVVYNKEDRAMITMKFDEVDMDSTFKDSYFSLKTNMSGKNIEISKPTSKLEDIIYPMYIPENTTLTSQDKVDKEDGERIILTFDGDNPFMLVQETSSYSEDMETIPMYGDPEIMADSVAAVSDTSITWISNGVEYYVVSETMKSDELLNVARSISALPVGK
ncbi:MAG TPA: outer membrane lipoprotein carrier protein LolA [Candidatus Pelethosoma merdigallinarum]|nr:outer membrane lipoprotein carrier protein LolA [Candidatus Pelethosoma merdigallinarum]